MAPMEIRPVYAGDLPGLVRSAGQETPVPTRIGGRLGDRVCDFEANPDGPWPRTPQEMARAVGVLVEVAEQIVDAVGDRADEPPTIAEIYVQGVWAAANWTVTTVEITPMTNVPRPVRDHTVAHEVQLARTLVVSQELTVAAYSGGVLAWFTWLAGVCDTVRYPDPEAF
jgi:hypothetical protein